MSETSPAQRSKRGNYLVIAILMIGVVAGVVAVLYWKFGVTVRKIEDPAAPNAPVAPAAPKAQP